MKVFYDSQAFDMQTHGGVSRYIYEIYRNRVARVEAELGVMETDNVYLQQLGIPSEGYTYSHFISEANFPLKRMLYKAYYNCKYGHAQLWDHTLLFLRECICGERIERLAVYLFRGEFVLTNDRITLGV